MAGSDSGTNPGDPDAEKGRNSDLADFEARLQRMQQSHRKPELTRGRSSAMGIAFRLTTELVVGIVVGAAIGIALDRWLGTRPWFLLVFFFAGMAAGILNVYRAAQQISAEAERDRNDDNKG